jgi:hypothetical protein
VAEEEGYCAGFGLGDGVFEADFQGVAGCRVEGDFGVGAVEGTLVGEDEDQDAAEFVGVVEVDEQVLAYGAAAAVVLVQADVGRAFEVAAAVAQGLDDAALARCELVQAAQVQVDEAAVADGRTGEYYTGQKVPALPILV